MPSSSSKTQNNPSNKKPKIQSPKKADSFSKSFEETYKNTRKKIWDKKRARVRLHQSFKRSYREDYIRNITVPGLLHHAVDTFSVIFKNWKLFVPLIIIAVIFNIALVGLMSESTYVQFQQTLEETNEKISGGEVGNFAKAGLLLISTVTTGGLTGSMGEAQTIFACLIFLIIRLVTIYLLRFRLADEAVKLRDGFYNALTPLLSTFVVFLVAFIQSLPIFIVIFAYSTAVQTDFLSTPFYALVFFIFASLFLLLSAYLLSSTLIAFVAVSAPGLYPFNALKTASDLMAGQRTRFIIRLIFLLFVLAVIWVVVMLPIITIDLWLKGLLPWLEGFPFIPIMLLVMTCFTFVYISAYLYLYYRRLLDNEDNQ